MKKYFYFFCAGFFALTMAVTFSSCDRSIQDLEENVVPDIPTGGEGQENNGNDNNTSITNQKYIEPCLLWGAQKSEISSWMKTHTKGFRLEVENDFGMGFFCYNPLITIAYSVPQSSGLIGVDMNYVNCTNSNAILKEIEKVHKLTFTPDPNDNFDYIANDVIINNKKTMIQALITSDTSILVIFTLSE